MEAVGAGMNRTVVIYFVVAFAIAFLSFRAIWFSFIMPIYEPVFSLGEEVGSIFNSGDFAAIGTWGALLFALGVALPLAFSARTKTMELTFLNKETFVADVNDAAGDFGMVRESRGDNELIYAHAFPAGLVRSGLRVELKAGVAVVSGQGDILGRLEKRLAGKT